ncbi:MAG: hypothetical protein HYZ68_06585 [Chloroflexi bacterium]|nr:hypothetical protein [Chloroflexota bacterium]
MQNSSSSISLAPSPERAIYGADPLARFLLARLGGNPHLLALCAWGLGLFYLLPLAAVHGRLQNQGGSLGSLQDWHAQILLLVVAPTLWAFYLWQPRAMAAVYFELGTLPGPVFARSLLPLVAGAFAVGVVLFDLQKMIVTYGSWWATASPSTIALRELSLALSFYMLAWAALRHGLAAGEWNRSLNREALGLIDQPLRRAVWSYCTISALVVALVGVRLSIEAIELPTRAGSITPDYYAKILFYVLAAGASFFVPFRGVWRQLDGFKARTLPMLVMAIIAALPLPLFFLLHTIVPH